MTRYLDWVEQPTRWIEGAPIGNGRLGAMVLGTTDTMHLQIADGTVWSGAPDTWRAELAALTADGAGPALLDKVRAQVRADDIRAAERTLLRFEGTYSQEFLPYVNLRATFRLPGSTATFVGRRLDLHEALYTDTIRNDETVLRRRAWASRPDHAVFLEVTTDTGVFDVDLRLTTRLREASREAHDGVECLGVQLPVDGAPLHEPETAPFRWPGDPLRPDHPGDATSDEWDAFAAAATSVRTDGVTRYEDGAFRITGARTVLVTLSSSTTAEDWMTGNPRPAGRRRHLDRAIARATRASTLEPHVALQRHRDDVRPLLTAATLSLDGGADAITVDRLNALAHDKATRRQQRHIAQTLFQYGRYLLVSASRPGGTAVNLQGLWNDDLRPPWSSNYTTNINVQMHYWAAETTGLGETVEPLVDLLKRMAETGTAVAASLYGAEGWVGHHNTDLWGWPLPVGMGHGDPAWAIWMVGGTWLTTHLMEHYRFQPNEAWLRERAWPILTGAAAFALSWLAEEDQGFLVTNPSSSPENHYVHHDGVAGTDRATALDRAVISQVLEDLIEAAHIIGLSEDDIVLHARETLARIKPDAVGEDGRIREWHSDRVDPNPAHGHFSAIASLYPLGRIHPRRTPDLAEAAAAFIDHRVHPAIGWPWTWSLALRARLGDGPGVQRILDSTHTPEGFDENLRGADAWSWGGTVPTLLRAHPPFQLDVSLGIPAAIAEFLLQSHAGELDLLPALPPSWSSGRVRGLRARGGYTVDLYWRDGQLSEAVLTATIAGGPVTVRSRTRTVLVDIPPGGHVVLDPELRIVSTDG